MERGDVDKKEIGKNKPKLVIASDTYLPRWDGISRFLYELIPLLKKRFEITIIAPRFSGKRPDIEGVNEVLMPLRKIRVGDFEFSKTDKYRMKSVIREADLIWTHTIGPIGRRTIRMGRTFKKKIIAYVHSIEWELFSRAMGKPLLYNPISMLSKGFVRNIYNRCDVLMMPSRESANLFTWYKINTRSTIAPLGVDTDEFKPPESKHEAKKSLGFSPSTNVIGYCGRIAHEKDLKTLVRAYQRVRDDFEDTRLVIVGEGLEELSSRFARIKGVMLAGSQNNVVPYDQAMDMYVLPSLTETTSLSTLEAMSCEIPVIATPVGEVKYYVKNNRNGFKFSKGNSFELAKHLEKLLSDDKLRNRLGKNGRKLVEEEYSWKKASEGIVDCLIGMVDKSR